MKNRMILEALNDELLHYGTEGMHWGIRRFQPYPSSYSGSGKFVGKRNKKLQRAAKKARARKKEEKKREAAVLAKKKKLIAEGNLDKIKKNINLFTNEELKTIMERADVKASLKTREEYNSDQKMEQTIKRMGQIADISSKAAVVFNSGKAGADMVASMRSAKLKNIEAEEKNMNRIKSEYEIRKTIDQTTANEWFDQEMKKLGKPKATL